MTTNPTPIGVIREHDGMVTAWRKPRDVGWTGHSYQAWCDPCGWSFTSPHLHHLTPAVDAISRHNRICPHVDDPSC